MKKLILKFIFTALIAGAAVSFAYAEDEPVLLYLKPDVAVSLNGEYLGFLNEAGEAVFPINYDGSTYLPVRAVSSLMEQPIEWVASSRMIFIGYSLSNLNGDYDKDAPKYAIRLRERLFGFEESIEEGVLKPDVAIYYNFEPQEFYDERGKRVYPLNFQGSTYLPIRAVSKLMGAEIEWDRRSKIVSIVKEEEKDKKTLREETIKLRDSLDAMEAIYADATKAIMGLSSENASELQATASAISGYLSEAVYENEADAELMTIESYTEDEEEAMKKVVVFGKTSEQYIQILENLAYMAVQGQDYSVLSDVFYQMALTAQKALEDAREAVQKCL